MPVEGTMAFNAITILEIQGIDYRTGQPNLTATAAYINTRNGKTYGQVTLKNCWAKETLLLLEQLRGAMERDMAALVLEEVATSPAPRGHDPAVGHAIHDVHGNLLGIGEELGTDAPSV